MATRAELTNGYSTLDPQASGRFNVPAGGEGSIQAAAPCAVWLLTNLADSQELYWSPAKNFSSANPATNPAAQRIGPGETQVIHSTQSALIVYNPGTAVYTVQVQAWRE